MTESKKKINKIKENSAEFPSKSKSKGVKIKNKLAQSEEKITNLERELAQSEEKITNLERELAQSEEKITNLERESRKKEANLLTDLFIQKKNHSEEIRSVKERLLSNFLFFPNDFDEALRFYQNDPNEKVKSFLDNFLITLAKFQDILQKEGVEEIKVVPFKDFYDINLHEANRNKEKNDNYPNGIILGVRRKGYSIGRRVLLKPLVRVNVGKVVEKKMASE